MSSRSWVDGKSVLSLKFAGMINKIRSGKQALSF